MKLFISYAVRESELAQKVKTFLNNAFEGKIKSFFSNDDLLPGDNWKRKIINGLNESDAILTIITPEYLKRPWMLIEWSAFWSHDKISYIFYTDDIDINGLPEPMKDVQLANLFNEKDIKKLVQKLSSELNWEEIPYKFIPQFIEDSMEIYKKIVENELVEVYKKYLFSPMEMSKNFEDIEGAFWYFYKMGQLQFAIDIFKRVKIENGHSFILVDLVKRGDYEFPVKLLPEIPDVKQGLALFFEELLNHGESSRTLIYKIIDHSSDSGVALKKFANLLIREGKSSSDYFKKTIESFKRTVELCQVGISLIDSNMFGRIEFEWVIKKFIDMQSYELKVILVYAIDKDLFTDPDLKFNMHLKKFYSYAESSAKKVLFHLAKFKGLNTAIAIGQQCNFKESDIETLISQIESERIGD